MSRRQSTTTTTILNFPMVGLCSLYTLFTRLTFEILCLLHSRYIYPAPISPHSSLPIPLQRSDRQANILLGKECAASIAEHLVQFRSKIPINPRICQRSYLFILLHCQRLRAAMPGLPVQAWFPGCWSSVGQLFWILEANLTPPSEDCLFLEIVASVRLSIAPR